MTLCDDESGLKGREPAIIECAHVCRRYSEYIYRSILTLIIEITQIINITLGQEMKRI